MNLEFKMNDRISPSTMVHSPFVNAPLNFRRERPGRDIAEIFPILYDFELNAEISTPRRQCADSYIVWEHGERCALVRPNLRGL